MHPKIVSERLGHANISITLDIYSHVLPGLQEEAAEKLERIFEADDDEDDYRKSRTHNRLVVGLNLFLVLDSIRN